MAMGGAPIVRTEIFAPDPTKLLPPLPPVPQLHLPLVWVPEGFVITPRETSGATQGWGMPRVACDWEKEGGARFTPAGVEGRGTPYSDTPWQYPRGSGAIKQVMLNRFKGNKKADSTLRALVAVMGEEVPSLLKEAVDRASKKATWWPFFFSPSDPIYSTIVFGGGLRFVSWQFEQYIAPDEDPEDPNNPCRIITPFSKAGVERADNCADHKRFYPLAEEEEGTAWYCHWPVEKPFTDETRLEVFRLTNALRADMGREPLFFPLETHGTAVGDVTAWQIKKHHIQSHNSLLFDRGYDSMVARTGSCTHYLGTAENLATVTPAEVADGDAPFASRLAQTAYDKWAASPAHYANMVDPHHTVITYDREIEEGEGKYTAIAGCLDVGKANDVTLTHVTDGYSYESWGSTPLDDPVVGTVLTQNFIRNQTWVGYGDVYWEGQDERVSWQSKRPFRYGLIRVNIQSLGYALDEHLPITDKPEIEYMLGRVFYYRGRQVLFSERYRVLGAALVKDNLAYSPEENEPNERALFRACLYDLDTRTILHTQLLSDVPYLRDAETVVGEGPTAEFEVVGSYALGEDDYAISHAFFSQDGSKCVVPVVSAGSESNSYYLTNVGTSNSWPTAEGCLSRASLSPSMEPINRDDLVVVDNGLPADNTVEAPTFERRLGNYTACYGEFSPRTAYIERFKRDNGIPYEESWIDERFHGVHDYYGVSPDEEPQYLVDEITWSKIRHVEFAPTPSVVSTYEPRPSLVGKTSSVTYTYEGGSSHSDCRREYGWEYTGSGNVYADYVNDTLTFAQVEIDMWWTSVLGSPYFKKTLKIGESSWVLADMLLDAEENAQQNLSAMAGVAGWDFYDIGPSNFSEGIMKLYELLHFDVRHPEDICYTGLDGGGWLMWDHKLNRKMSRQLYVRNELVWESEPIIRTPTNETSFNTFTDGLNYTFDRGEFASLEFPKAYSGVKWPLYYRFLGISPHHAAAFASLWNWNNRQNGGVPFYEPQYVFDVNQPFHTGRNLLWGTTAFTGGFPSRLWPRDAAGLTAMDEVVYEPIRDVTSKGPIGSFPSFMPWAQKDSTLVRDNSGILHCTQAWFLRYKEEFIFQLYQPYWLHVGKDSGAEEWASWELHGLGHPPAVGEHPTHDRYLSDIEHLEPRDNFYINWPDTRKVDGTRVSGAGSSVGEAYSDWYDEAFQSVGWQGTEGYSMELDNSPKDGCWAVFSSLNLRSITGIPALSDNLYPLGVI
jgi:hypothetical protein